MAVQKFPAQGLRVTVYFTRGGEQKGTCLYHLSSQWVLGTDSGRELVVHKNDGWEYDV